MRASAADEPPAPARVGPPGRAGRARGARRHQHRRALPPPRRGPARGVRGGRAGPARPRRLHLGPALVAGPPRRGPRRDGRGGGPAPRRGRRALLRRAARHGAGRAPAGPRRPARAGRPRRRPRPRHGRRARRGGPARRRLGDPGRGARGPPRPAPRAGPRHGRRGPGHLSGRGTRRPLAPALLGLGGRDGVERDGRPRAVAGRLPGTGAPDPGAAGGVRGRAAARRAAPGPRRAAVRGPDRRRPHALLGRPGRARRGPARVPRMMAIVVREPGGPEVLEPAEVADPVAGPGEVVLRVAATAVNRADLMQRMGRYPPPPGASEILGLDAAGTVAEVGEGVAGWAPGDRAMALLAGGGYAELVAVPVVQLLPVPEGLGLAEAAAV